MAKKPKIETCIECDERATYIRHTQFAGDHPFCEECAKEEKGFMVEDSYQFWSVISGPENP
jgi:hypothetical protein